MKKVEEEGWRGKGIAGEHYVRVQEENNVGSILLRGGSNT